MIQCLLVEGGCTVLQQGKAISYNIIVSHRQLTTLLPYEANFDVSRHLALNFYSSQPL